MRAALITSLIAFASAAVIQNPRTLSGWEAVGKTDATKEIRVTISLKRNVAALTEHIHQTAWPTGKNFRKWASKDEVTRLNGAVSPNRVISWLASHGITGTTIGPNVVSTVTVAQAEALFATSVEDYSNAKTGVWHSASHLHAPAEVAADIEAVFGLHGMPLPPRETKLIPASDSAGAMAIKIGPKDIRTAYTVSGRGSGSQSNRQAVAEFQGQYANAGDLSTFFSDLVPYAQPGDDKIYAFKGQQGSGVGTEALLDIEYIMGVAPGILTEFWAWKNFDFCSDLKNWTTTLLNDENPPVVHSISYGWQGDLNQIGCSAPEVASIDSDLMTLGSRGVSVIFASGDSGSQYKGTVLYPSWPASSKWVTAVGATEFTDSTYATEMASTQFGSGSGFSSFIPVPEFQQSVVNSYVQGQGQNLPQKSLWQTYNSGTTYGRGTADVSAVGEGYEVVIRGNVYLVGGTSAATPTFAAIISLVNEQVGTPLGYLNPFLYNNPSAFRDVTIGNDGVSRQGTNYTCTLENGNSGQCGFPCAAGWDPATGLGTPIYTALLAAAQQQ